MDHDDRSGSGEGSDPLDVSRQEAKKKRSETINIVLAASVAGLLRAFLEPPLPSYVASGISVFAFGLVAYPSLGRKDYSFGRWSLRTALGAIAFATVIFIGPIVRSWMEGE